MTNPTAITLPDNLPHPLPWAHRVLPGLVFAAFRRAKIELRYVGGCVRDALMRQTTHNMDIDLATPATPDEITKILLDAGLGAKPTGIAFGTITATYQGDHVQITTLREDITTDGRHAVVRFGKDWQQDAARRDFTINALYADEAGALTDYYGGKADLENGIVRFIGDPLARVREDHLRILRFFRFHARFARGEPDPEALGACAALKNELQHLSAERVWQEFSRLLTIDVPHRGAMLMALTGVLDALFSAPDVAPDIERLADYAQAEAHHDFHAVPVLRLAALYPDVVDALALRFKLSQKETLWLDLAADTMKAEDPAAMARVWYWHHETIARAPGWLPNLAFLYVTARGIAGATAADAVVTFAASWESPVFPLTGADMMSLGMTPGPQMGEVLDAVERWWVAQDFAADRNACLAKARDFIG